MEEMHPRRRRAMHNKQTNWDMAGRALIEAIDEEGRSSEFCYAGPSFIGCGVVDVTILSIVEVVQARSLLLNVI
jgi:hypothetical protein